MEQAVRLLQAIGQFYMTPSCTPVAASRGGGGENAG